MVSNRNYNGFVLPIDCHYIVREASENYSFGALGPGFASHWEKWQSIFFNKVYSGIKRIRKLFPKTRSFCLIPGNRLSSFLCRRFKYPYRTH